MTWQDEKAINRRAALLAREMRSQFPHMAEWAYLRTLAVARLTVETLIELETQRGPGAVWSGALEGSRAREKAREHRDELRMLDTHSSDVDPGDPYR